MSDKENNQEPKHKFTPVFNISSAQENKRLAKIKELEKAANAYTDQLARFPERPRGKYTSLEEAAALGGAIIMEYEPDELKGLYKAAEFLKELADRENRDMEAAKPTRRNVSQNTVVFVYDVGDTEETLLRKLGEYFKESGKGSRTNIESLSRMVRCFLEFDRDGLPLPINTILIEHLQYDAFRAALKEDGVLDKVRWEEERIADKALKEGATPEKVRRIEERLSMVAPKKTDKETDRIVWAGKRLATASKGTRGRIQQAARHRLESAGELFVKVMDEIRNTPPANDDYKEIVYAPNPPSDEKD